MGYELSFNAADVAPDLVVQAPNHVGEATPPAFRLSQAFVPKTPEEQRIIDVALRNEALMAQTQGQMTVPTPAPKPRAAAPILAASPTYPADRQAILQEICRLAGTLGDAPAEISSPFATGLFKGTRWTCNVDSPAERESMTYLVNLMREAGAKVGFVIGGAGEEKTKGKITSFATTTGKARIQDGVIRQLKAPIFKALAERPRTTKELMSALEADGYTHNTYFKVNQMLHILGCQKKPFSNPETRGPSYIWSLPAEGVAE